MNPKDNKFEQLLIELDSVEGKVADLMNALHESEERRFDLEKQILQLRKENEVYRTKYDTLVKESMTSRQEAGSATGLQEADREKAKQKIATLIDRLDGFLKEK